LSTGGVSKVTLTGKLAELELLLLSVAVQVTLEAPIGARVPEAGLQTTVGLASTTSVAVGGLCWMGIGAFIMAKMVNFEI